MYDGIRLLYRHTRVAPHQSVMGAHPLQSVMGGTGLKTRHRSARSLATLEKRHRVQLNHFNGLDMLLRVRHPMYRNASSL